MLAETPKENRAPPRATEDDRAGKDAGQIPGFIVDFKVLRPPEVQDLVPKAQVQYSRSLGFRVTEVCFKIRCAKLAMFPC